jgi:hypothetical protein
MSFMSPDFYTSIGNTSDLLNLSILKELEKIIKLSLVEPDSSLLTQEFVLSLKPSEAVKTTLVNELYIFQQTAKVMREILLAESISKLTTKYYPRSSYINMRHLCDCCSTSIFDSFMCCSHCCKEICHSCFEGWDDSTVQPTDSSSVSCLNVIYRCAYERNHYKKEFIVITKLSRDAVVDTMAQIDTILRLSELNSLSYATSLATTNFVVSSDDRAKLPSFNIQDDSQDYLRISGNSADGGYSLFKDQWAQGKALVFEAGANSLKADWSPKYFMDHHGDETAIVVDCRTKSQGLWTVNSYFMCYLDANLRPDKQILKIPVIFKSRSHLS